MNSKAKRLAVGLVLGLLVVHLLPASVRAADCDGNSVPDDQDPDCNSNGLPDACDISGKLYWVDSNTDRLQRSNFNGSRVETLVSSGLGTPRGIAVDTVGGKVYWTDVFTKTQSIKRANLDGTGVEPLITTDLSSPRGIALDVDAGKMYWTDSGNHNIRRSNLDGTSIEPLVTTGTQNPYGIALDVAGGKMYWVDSFSSAPKIQRANLDGTGVIETLVTTPLTLPFYIALDLTAGKMYWTDNSANTVRRANLDGSSVQLVINNTVAIAPTGIAVDPVTGKLYWGNNGDDRIYSANLDGTSPDDIVLAVVDPFGIALAFPIDDADENGVPDECEGTPPTLLGAFVSKPNSMGPGGFCDLPIDMAPGAPITSEPRVGGITDVSFSYDGPASGEVAVESDCVCPSPPSYAPIDPTVSCLPDGNVLVCTFDPELPNACTYRLTVSSGAGTASVELRGLVGDVDSSGRVNATDRSVVVGVWTSTNFDCETDLDGNGRTHGADRSLVVGGWTGGQNCAP